MTDLYYNGDLGDIGNADWFFADNHNQLKDITSVGLVTTHPAGGTELHARILYQNGCQADGKVVRAPNQRRHNYVDPHMVGQQLVSLKLERHRDAMHYGDVFQARLEHVEVDGQGRCHQRRDIPVWAIKQTIDDYMMASVDKRQAEEIVKHTIRDMGAKIGIKMMEEIVARTPIDTGRISCVSPNSSYLRFQEEPRLGTRPLSGQRGERIIVDDVERGEGDDLMDFFMNRGRYAK